MIRIIFYGILLLSSATTTGTLCSARDKHDSDLHCRFTRKAHKHIIDWLLKRELAHYFTRANVTVIHHQTNRRHMPGPLYSIFMKIPRENWDTYIEKFNPFYTTVPTLGAMPAPLARSFECCLAGMTLGFMIGHSAGNDDSTSNVEKVGILTGGLVGVLIGGLWGMGSEAATKERALKKQLTSRNLHLVEGEEHNLAPDSDSVVLDLKPVVYELAAIYPFQDYITIGSSKKNRFRVITKTDSVG